MSPGSAEETPVEREGEVNDKEILCSSTCDYTDCSCDLRDLSLEKIW